MSWIILQLVRPFMLSHILLHIVDYVTTAMFINNLDVNIEGNFIAHYIIESFGLVGLGIFKFFILTLVTCIVLYMYRKNKIKHGFLILSISVILTSVAQSQFQCWGC